MEYKSSEYYREHCRILRDKIDEIKPLATDSNPAIQNILRNMMDAHLHLTRLQLISHVGETQTKIYETQRSRQIINEMLKLPLIDQLTTENVIKGLWKHEIELRMELKKYQDHIWVTDQYIELGGWQ